MEFLFGRNYQRGDNAFLTLKYLEASNQKELKFEHWCAKCTEVRGVFVENSPFLFLIPVKRYFGKQ